MSAIGWQVWALLSAIFAAFTAVLAKVGVGPIWTKPAPRRAPSSSNGTRFMPLAVVWFLVGLSARRPGPRLGGARPAGAVMRRVGVWPAGVQPP